MKSLEHMEASMFKCIPVMSCYVNLGHVMNNLTSQRSQDIRQLVSDCPTNLHHVM